jgi:methionine-rich copper-binding protein CopC
MASGSILSSGARGTFLALAVWLLAMGIVHAHSGLQRAEPPAESTVARPPEEVKLYFSEALEPAYSSVRVEDAGGTRVDDADSRVDRSDPQLLRVSLPPLAPGVYTVVWRVLSVDSHVTEGRYTFRVE